MQVDRSDLHLAPGFLSEEVKKLDTFSLSAQSTERYDRVSRGRIHPVSLWGGILLFAWAGVRGIVIGPSTAWHEFVAWLIR